jgi:hypothetical protein
MRSEILSYEEIIKVLQNEISNKELSSKPELLVRKEDCGDQFQANTDKEWEQVTTRNNRKLNNFNSNLVQLIPTTGNKYELLHNLNDDELQKVGKDLRTQNKSNNLKINGRNQGMESVKRNKHKVLIIGDSHTRKCAVELRHNLDHRYEVSGFIKPGATTQEIVKTTEDEISALKSNDVLILWVGANDISRNNTKEAQKCILKFMEVHKKTKIILLSSPLRHDLLLSSCVNKEVVKFNRQLKKIAKLYTNVELLEVELQRKHFTRHGQHLNVSGKELVSLELSKTIELLLNQARTTPIQMRWRDDNLNDGNLGTQSKDVNPVGLGISKNCTKTSNNDVDISKKENSTKLSVRPKKVPVTRSKDFLW